MINRTKLFILLFFVSSFGFGFNAIISATLATTYSTSSPSLQATLSNLFLRATPTLMIANPTSCRICANTISTATVAPTAGNGKEYCIPANAIGFWDVVNIPRGPANVYIRADGTSCTPSTQIDVGIW